MKKESVFLSSREGKLRDDLNHKYPHAALMEAIEEMAEAALKDACTATNPRVPTKREVMELYKKIW